MVLSGPSPDPVWLDRIALPLATHPGLTFCGVAGRIHSLSTVRESRPLRFLPDAFRCRLRRAWAR